MVYNRLPNNLPETLRKHGLKVVEVPGWETRGRSASHGDFDPVGVLNHHTATGTNWTNKAVVDLLMNGRSDLPGPLVQFGTARDGTVYLVASGRCNHAATAKASGTVAAGDGNALYIGNEIFNDGIAEVYPKVQYDAAVLLNAILNVYITKNSAQTSRGHKETSITGKPDPKFDMDKFRSAVANKMKELTGEKIPVVVKESIVVSKPGPVLTHPGTIGKAVEFKVPLSAPVAVKGGVPYNAASVIIPKGHYYLLTLQVRMPADLVTEAEMEFVRIGWEGLAREDSTGHNHVPRAVKINGEWYRWRTFNHAFYGGGLVEARFISPKDLDSMRFVVKALCLA